MWPKLPPGNNLNLPGLTAEQLTRALAVHFQGAGGLVCDADLEIARELVHRAKKLEAAEAGLRKKR